MALLLAQGPELAAQSVDAQQGGSCVAAGCHGELLEPPVSHPVSNGAGMCATCHRAVEGQDHAFAVDTSREGGCLSCHADLIAATHRHAPADGGLCLTCHKLHGGEAASLHQADAGNLCRQCHSQRVPEESKHKHGPAAEWNCTACHDPHSSAYEWQLRVAVPDLCFGCHDSEQVDNEGNTLLAIKPIFDDKSLHQHPAFERGQCTLCHDPHTSDYYRLQKGPYPESSYAQFAQDRLFCTNCHGTQAFAEPRTLTATRFRNGNLNLHERHLNRSKGRACRMCHDHHASDREAQIGHRVSFGDRYLEIAEYSRTGSGGSCSPSCHRPMRYDRLEPVDNGLMVTARKGIDATPEELLEPIPLPDGATVFANRCQGCHGSHAGGRVGPIIRGRTPDDIRRALDNTVMMWALSSLTNAEIEAVAGYLQSTRLERLADERAAGPDGRSLFKTICATCHGVDAGGGLAGLAPRIAGATRERIVNAIATVDLMRNLDHLDTDELDAIWHFVAEDPVINAASGGPAPELDGGEIYGARCAACHGRDATGGPAGLGPNILGKTGADIGDAIGRVPLMSSVANLTSAEIEAVAGFLAPRIAAAASTGESREADGQAVFASVCAACHGADARGAVGPDIVGKSGEDIEIAFGRVPMMQVLATLEPEEIRAVGDYLSGPAFVVSAQSAAVDGQQVFAARCRPCHGPSGEGGPVGLGPRIRGVIEDQIRTAIGTIPMMAGVSDVSDQEIAAIAQFLGKGEDQ